MTGITNSNKKMNIQERIAKSCGEIRFIHGQPIVSGDSNGGLSLFVTGDEERGFDYTAIFLLNSADQDWKDLRWTVKDPFGVPVCMGRFDRRGRLRFRLSPGQNPLLGDVFTLDISAEQGMQRLVRSAVAGRLDNLHGHELRTLFESGDYGFKRLHVPCIAALAADGGTKAPKVDDWVGCRYDHASGKVLLKIPEDQVPHGLLRVYLIDQASDRVFTWLPELTLEDGFWWGEAPLKKLRRDIPGDNRIDVDSMQPAKEDNRDFFDNEAVRSFVAGLPQESPQARRANEYWRRS